jgi:hypothetical protein
MFSKRAAKRRVERELRPVSEFSSPIREEWTVKAYLSPERAESWLVEAEASSMPPRQTLALSPRKRFLREQQLKAAAGREASRWGQAIAAEIVEAVRETSAEFRVLEPEARRPGGLTAEAVLSLACVLPSNRVEEFHGKIGTIEARYRARGLTLECRGPRPRSGFLPAVEVSLT